MSTVVATLPKVDLYCRFEGAVGIHGLAAQAGKLDKAEGDVAAVRRRLAFSDTESFAKAHEWLLDLFTDAGTFEIAANHFGRRMLRANVIHNELHVAVGEHERRGVDAVEAVKAIDRGMEAAVEDDERFLSWGQILDFRRGTDPAAAVALLTRMLDAELPNVIGVAISGPGEVGDAKALAPLFEMATKAEIGCVVEAGETGDGDAVQEALDIGAGRIVHGLRALKKPDVIAHLRAHRIPVVICPSLEVRRGTVRSLATHPVDRMMQEGIYVAIATGHPGLLEQDLNAEYELLSKHLHWRLPVLQTFANRAINAGFIEPRLRFHLGRMVETWDPRR